MTASNQMRPAERKIATLDTLSASQVAAIRSIPRHDAAQAPQQDDRRPASIFVDEGRFALEREKLIRRLPVAVSLSTVLSAPGSVMAHDGYGLPILLTRDRQGRIRAFLNVCRHKGSKIIETCEPHKAGRLSCPYHAWTYALDGQLIGLPRAETFPSVDKADFGLVPLHCKEAGGIIWVILDHKAEPDFSGIVPQLIEDMDALGIGSAHAYGRRTFSLNANWKLVIEPFLEGYHVQRLHAQSVGPLFADVPNATHRLGTHIRQISGKAQFEPEMIDIPGENIHKTVTHAYMLFPNTVVVTSPYYISVMIIMPNSVNKSTVDYFMLTPGPADNPKAEELYSKSYTLIQKVFGTEDFRAAEISQQGLEAGAIDEVVYGGLEASIPEFYRTLESFL